MTRVGHVSNVPVTKFQKGKHVGNVLHAGGSACGCGVPEDFITYLPSLIGTMQPIQ